MTPRRSALRSAWTRAIRSSASVLLVSVSESVMRPRYPARPGKSRLTPVNVAASLRQGPARQRDEQPGRGRGEQGEHHPAPHDRQGRAEQPNCHGSRSVPASRTAEPRIAPIAAGPAPSRNACATRLVRSTLKYPAPASTKTNEGENATSAASKPPPRPAAA